VKVGLYSITYLGLWYRGEALTFEELIGRAKQYGYDGIEIDGKRPHANPLDMPTERCREVRAMADEQGIEMVAVAANNDFSSPIPEYRECQLVYLRELLRVTADLGAKLVRVFLAWPGVTVYDGLGSYEIARPAWHDLHKGLAEEQIWAWCRDALIESARYAGEYGVTLALQNHAPVITDHHDVLRMVREVGSPHLRVCLDAPLLPQQDAAYARQAARDVGDLQVLSHFGGEYERDADGRAVLDKGKPNLPAFVRAMREMGYEGYFNYELCHPLPVVDGETVGIEFADKNAQLAAEYAQAIIAEAAR